MKLINADCLVAMQDIPDGSVDMVMTSPPYDNLRTYNGNNDLWGPHVWQAVIKSLYRVLKDGGVCVWVVGDATIKGSETGTSFKQALWAMDCGFNLHDTMIWRKTTVMPRDTRIPRYWQGFEYMFVFSKGRPSTCNFIREECKYAGTPVKSFSRKADGELRLDRKKKTAGNVRGDTKPRSNVWDYAPRPNKFHPAAFPQPIAQDHIKSWSNEGQIVLDPFMGSGTTMVACKNLNRDGIGIELDFEYYKIACERINSVDKERLF